MFVSAKYCEIYPPALNYFSEVTDRTYTKQEILDMESKLLVVLDFDMSHCSQLGFFERYSNLSRLDAQCYNLGRYTMELGLLDCRFIKYQPSMIACAAIYLAGKIFKKYPIHPLYDKKMLLVHRTRVPEWLHGVDGETVRQGSVRPNTARSTNELAGRAEEVQFGQVHGDQQDSDWGQEQRMNTN